MSKLYLELSDGTLYTVTALPGGGWRLLQLQGKRQGAAYTVTLPPFGYPACDCPDAQFRARPGGCKHQVGLREVGLLPTAVAAAGGAT